MRLLPLDAVVGVLLLAAIAFAAQRSSRSTPSARVRASGWALVAGPLPLAVLLHLIFPPRESIDQAAFLAGAAAFAIGALIILSRDTEDWREEADESSPPWWPAFERNFREYELESSRRRRVVRL
jgi:hypothetical protein